ERSSLVNGIFTSFIDERFRSVFREHLGAVLRSRGKERCELQLMRKEGRPVFISMESISMKEEDNIRIRSAVSDITDRKRVEEEVLRLNAELEAKVTNRTAQLEAANRALKDEIAERVRAEEEIHQSEREFRAIFELSSVGMAQRDISTGLIIRLNQRLCEMTGYSAKELLNQKDIMLTHPDYRKKDQEVRAGVLKGESDTWLIEKQYVRKNGEVIWVQVNGRLIRDSSGQPFRTVAVIQDITERKRAEEVLADRTVQLERINRKLVALNAELDDFTYVAGHDLQEPLRNLAAFIHLLREDLGDSLSQKAARDLGFITDAATRMQTLIQGLLALSRTGRVAKKKEKVSLDECADRALQALSLRLKETGAQITRDKMPEVWGDSTLLTELYQNLIGNALKFSKEPRPIIWLTVEAQGDDQIFGVTNRSSSPSGVSTVGPSMRARGSGWPSAGRSSSGMGARFGWILSRAMELTSASRFPIKNRRMRIAVQIFYHENGGPKPVHAGHPGAGKIQVSDRGPCA
ncbi:MAG: multi-sensor signal transduction histidine kinase, partial [Deltaproteobacteria bacterium]|nr:multi-sensor signal transduction histidine kinase [Deltaproteobacteria bacterium]